MGRKKAWDAVGEVPQSEIEDLIASYGAEPRKAFEAVDMARATGEATNPLLKGRSKRDLAQLDRATSMADLARNNAPVTMAPLVFPAAVGTAAAYEALKMSPPLMRALSKVPGLQDFAPTPNMSPPSMANVNAAAKGYLVGSKQQLQGIGQRIPGLLGMLSPYRR